MLVLQVMFFFSSFVSNVTISILSGVSSVSKIRNAIGIVVIVSNSSLVSKFIL